MLGKKYKKALEQVDRARRYSLEEALGLIEKTGVAKFDETVDLAVRLGIDPKQSDQMVRGATPLPHGLGKTVRIVVFARGDKAKEAETAGADFVGADDLVAKILNENWLEFDKVLATPDLMVAVSKLGKVLGPRGLMPNPKTGTVTPDIGRAVQEQKAGKVEFKIDKAGIVHVPVGKRSFGPAKLKDNITVVMEAILRAKPATSKGTYLKSVTLSSTMGPGIKLDTHVLQEGEARA